MWYNHPAIKKLNTFFILAISLFILFYVTYKASLTSFTHDESYTYLHYVHQPVKDIITYKDPFTNNHILNTLLMKVSEKAFGNSEIVLRLPNILSLVIYLRNKSKFCH